MWGKNKHENPGGTDFEAAAARVTAEAVTEEPNADAERAAANYGKSDLADALQGETEKLEIRPEWAVWIARSPYALGAKLWHPAFALSDEQAEKLGPKLLPLIRKVTDVWIPSWLAGASNRNPELTDAVLALAVTGYVQYMHVQKVIQAEAEAAENAKRVKGERVTDPDLAFRGIEMPLRSDSAPEPEPRIIGGRLADGSLVI